VTEKLDNTEVNVAITMITATAIKVVDSDGATASAVLQWSISGKGRKSIPDNTVLYMGIVFGVLTFAVGLFFWLYSKFGKRGIKAGKEREVSVDVKLRKILDSKIHMQDTMTLIEVRPPSSLLPTSTRLLTLLHSFWTSPRTSSTRSLSS
jgi:hypothetical protein